MNDHTMSPEQTAAVFADPVRYLAELGIAAVLVTTPSLAAAA